MRWWRGQCGQWRGVAACHEYVAMLAGCPYGVWDAIGNATMALLASRAGSAGNGVWSLLAMKTWQCLQAGGCGVTCDATVALLASRVGGVVACCENMAHWKAVPNGKPANRVKPATQHVPVYKDAVSRYNMRVARRQWGCLLPGAYHRYGVAAQPFATGKDCSTVDIRVTLLAKPVATGYGAY